MNKKMILKVSSIILVIALIIVGYFIINKSDKSEEPNKNVDNEIEDNENNGQNENDNNNSTIPSDSKILVVYYSASGSTKKVAEQIKENLNADLFEVIPEEIYTSQDLNWNDVNSRVSREHNDESLRDVKLKNTTVSNWNDYDTVIIGYPIWWGIAA